MDTPRKFYLLDELFEQARMNPHNPMNEGGRLQGRHCVARKLRAQAKRKNGRVKNGVRKRAGRKVFGA